MKKLILLATVVLCMGLPSKAFAITEITIPIANYAVIAPTGHPEEATVLLEVPFPDSLIVPDSLHIPDSLRTFYILHSELVCRINPVLPQDSIFEVAMVPINIAWNRQYVGWNNAWRESGGYLIDTMLTLAGVVTSAQGPARIDITDIMLRWADGTYPNHGLAIKAPADMPRRFQVTGPDPRRPELAILKILVISTRK